MNAAVLAIIMFYLLYGTLYVQLHFKCLTISKKCSDLWKT